MNSMLNTKVVASLLSTCILAGLLINPISAVASGRGLNRPPSRFSFGGSNVPPVPPQPPKINLKSPEDLNSSNVAQPRESPLSFLSRVFSPSKKGAASGQGVERAHACHTTD